MTCFVILSLLTLLTKTVSAFQDVKIRTYEMTFWMPICVVSNSGLYCGGKLVMERTYKNKYISTSCFQSIFIPENKQVGLFFYCRDFCLYISIGIFVVIVIVALFHFVVVKLNSFFGESRRKETSWKLKLAGVDNIVMYLQQIGLETSKLFSPTIAPFIKHIKC